MKKAVKYSIILVLIVSLLAVMLTACGTANGLSAYEIAVKNGFEGTETDWLESLKGNDGTDGINGINGMDGADGQITFYNSLYEEAIEKGYSGTYFEFLQEYIQSNAQSSTVAVASNEALKSVASVVSYYTIKNTSTNYASGSAVIYKDDTVNKKLYLITNYHVIYYSKATPKISNRIEVYLYGAEVSAKAMSATVIGGILEEDIAVIMIENDDYDLYSNSISTPANIGNSSTVRAGDTSIAVGNASGNGISVTSGIVSVDSEVITLTSADDVTSISPRVIRTDAPVNPGNSGGGLFNDKAELIGIVNAKTVSSTEESMGYAIPTSVAVGIANKIIATYETTNTTVTTVEKPLLGITIELTNSKSVYNENTLQIDIVEQITIKSVEENSILYGLLQVGDELTSIEHLNQTYDVTRNFVIPDLLWNCSSGDSLKIYFTRDTSLLDVTITLSTVKTYSLDN